MTDYSDHQLDIWTDGSSYEGPRSGGAGWEFVWIDQDGEVHTLSERTERWPGATNNEMELQAVIEALKQATGRRPPVDPSTYDKIVVNTDSEYIAKGYRRMLFQWSKNGWKLADAGVPENVDQWRELMTLVRRVRRMRKVLDVEWVPRRTGPSGRRVDDLAKESAQSLVPTRLPLRPRNVTRKHSANRVRPGCVPMEGQTETIRITGHWVLGRQHRGTYNYTYEVVGGPHDQLVDRAVSTELMHRAHVYEVQLNEDQGSPQILEVLREVEPQAAADGS